MNVEKFFNSQCGEDIYIHQNIKLPINGIYVDVGSAHPVINSNTFWLDVMGWKGYCFEPDTAWHEEYPELRSERCTLIKSAVGSFSGEIGFGVSPLHELSKIDSENENKVKITTLKEAIDSLEIPKVDFLSIDVEGNEWDVLCSINWNHTRPIVVIVEYNTLGVISSESEKFFYKNFPEAYMLVHSTPLNHIFVRYDYLKYII